MAAALFAITVTACGTQQGGPAQSAGPRPSFSPRPQCAQPAEAPADLPSSPVRGADGGHQKERQEENADRPPHYAENHAYRHQAPMTAEKRARGQASAELIRAELEKVRSEGGAGAYGVFAEERVAAALARLGCGEEHGVYIGNGFYSVHTGIVCVSGRVTKDELTSEVHGAYAEPQPGTGPCVENRGGH
ncbi:hypothetical protein GCM10010294_00150 [Streptomyces griseoloalbus]|uniref:hypothetical protein n=1 Tax=Streptomyces griseoloalbus TaxID=67303 RepID=UPI0019CE836B|nr:hypothetical protein GCM10010294_00150 [Streptomyces griseoloalbus]